MNTIEPATLTAAEMERAWRARDASYDGLFFCGVTTTGIFCRPSCPSRPKREHLEFFLTQREAINAGYRPCKRCQPELANGTPPAWVAELMNRAAASPDTRLKSADVRALGVSAERARRWFQQNYGMSFAAWCRGRRLANAFTEIRNGAPLDDVILGHGFESHSGFRDAFARTFGKSPGRSRNGDCLHATLLDTPLGPMLAAAGARGVCFLGFADRRELEQTHADIRRRFDLPVVPGENEILKTLSKELRAYFDGKLRRFSAPLTLRGTPFQERVWRELLRVPHGRTASYEEIARNIGAPKAVRAVARANAANPLCLVVPCHRIIAKDGSLSGYGGGVWRKRALIELERTGALPGQN